MAFSHGLYHFIALLIKFYASKCNSIVAEFLHQILKYETVRVTVWVIVPTITILFAVTWSIKDVEYLFRRVSTPLLVQAFSETSNNVFRKISSTSCDYFRDEILGIINIFCKIFDGKSLFAITMISISNEAYFHGKVAITAGDNIVNYLFQRFLRSCDPAAHGARAVK